MTTPCPHCQRPMTDEVVVDPLTLTVRHRETRIKLSPAETAILHRLWDSRESCVTDDQLIFAVHGHGRDMPDRDHIDEDNVLKVQMCHLRKKIVGLPFTIETVWGKGYRYVPGKAA